MATATITLPTSSFYFKEGSSDKEYHLAILGDDTKGFQVQYRHGRKGGSMTVKFKNPVPIGFDAAKLLYDDMVKERFKKGYTQDASGTPYVGTENQGTDAGVRPMLLGEITEEEVQKYLDNDDWLMQEKKNGVRKMIRKVRKVLEGINKKGLITPLPETTANAIRNICQEADVLFDGELVGEVYWIFDLLSAGVHSYADKSLTLRLEGIQEWFGPWGLGIDGQCARLVPTAVGKSSKKALFKLLKAENAEGVVFKRRNTAYKAGRSDDNVKFKWYATATVRVRCLNEKNSFQMEMMSKGNWVGVGDCTFYPTKYVPKPGDFVEVRYMYALKGGSLYGPPVILEHRTDADDGDCGMSQIKYKPDTEAPEDDES